MECDPENIVSDAACLSCVPTNTLLSLRAFLFCSSGAGSDARITEDSEFRITESGELRVVQ